MKQREIKFRVWDNTNKKMYSVDDLRGLWKLGIPVAVHQSLDDKHDVRLRIDENPLMQFTGLKDKNGKEIYEGDVVRNRSSSMMGIVEFGELANSLGRYQGWNIRRYLKLGKTKTENWGNPHWEVIGNIYETPELLTK